MHYNHNELATSQLGAQPLHYAATTGKIEVIQLLVDVYKVPADAVAMVEFVYRKMSISIITFLYSLLFNLFTLLPEVDRQR